MLGIKVILVVSLSVGLIIGNVNAQCLCGAQGDDYCSCSPQVVRPQQLPAAAEYRPRQCCIIDDPPSAPQQTVEDPCQCNNAIVVQPAQQPNRVPCTKCNRPSCGCNAAPAESLDIFAVPRTRPIAANTVPVDAISLGLAYKAAQQASAVVPEERLQYGFRTRPKNAQKSKVVPDIPEEKLQAVDKAVVELQLRKKNDEFEEELDEEEEEEIIEEATPNRLAYSDIGYLPAKQKEPRFTVQHYGRSATASGCNHQNKLSQQAQTGNGGFRQANVIHQVASSNAVTIDEHQLDDADLQNAEIIDINFVDGQYAGVGYDRFRRQLSQAILDAVRKTAEDVSMAKVEQTSELDELKVNANHTVENTLRKQEVNDQPIYMNGNQSEAIIEDEANAHFGHPTAIGEDEPVHLKINSSTFDDAAESDRVSNQKQPVPTCSKANDNLQFEVNPELASNHEELYANDFKEALAEVPHPKTAFENANQSPLLSDRQYLDEISKLVATLSQSLQRINDGAFAKDILFVPDPQMVHEANEQQDLKLHAGSVPAAARENTAEEAVFIAKPLKADKKVFEKDDGHAVGGVDK